MSTQLPSSSEMVPSEVSRQVTIAIVGGSYVGKALALALLPMIPDTHRVVVVEANSHFHHLFTLPRFSVVRGAGEEKALIPYDYVLESGRANGRYVHARALSIHEADGRGYLQLDRAVDGSDQLGFDYLALATGTCLPAPWTLPATSLAGAAAKQYAVGRLRSHQEAVRIARRIVIVGGGAVGVQAACDIAQLYPNKHIVLVHSRARLMHTFHPQLDSVVRARLAELRVHVLLNNRVQLPHDGFPQFASDSTVKVQTEAGHQLDADLVLMCTGQKPRAELLAAFAPHTITPTGYIAVRPTLQIEPGSPLADRIFALGDIAHSGAAKSVRAAAGHIDVVTHNILALIAGSTGPLRSFQPGPAAIHLSLGLHHSIKFANPPSADDPPRNLGIQKDLALDMNIEATWARWNVPAGTPWNL